MLSYDCIKFANFNRGTLSLAKNKSIPIEENMYVLAIYKMMKTQNSIRFDDLSMIRIGQKCIFNNLRGKRFLKSFRVLILQILRIESSMVVCEVSQRNFKTSAYMLIGQ